MRRRQQTDPLPPGCYVDFHQEVTDEVNTAVQTRHERLKPYVRSVLIAAGLSMVFSSLAPMATKTVDGLFSRLFWPSPTPASGPLTPGGTGHQQNVNVSDPNAMTQFGNTIVQGSAVEYYEGAIVQFRAKQRGKPYKDCVAINLGEGTTFYVTPDYTRGSRPNTDGEYSTKLPIGTDEVSLATCQGTVLTSGWGQPVKLDPVLGSPDNNYKFILPPKSQPVPGGW
jgi:hypothetical protein